MCGANEGREKRRRRDDTKQEIKKVVYRYASDSLYVNGSCVGAEWTEKPRSRAKDHVHRIEECVDKGWLA